MSIMQTQLLPAVTGADLPRLVYAHSADHDPTLTLPNRFRPIQPGGYVKPNAGGMWTAPVTEAAADGTPAQSAWTDW